MYHTAFSKLYRTEIEAMLKLLVKIDPKSKYSAMRLLPLSIADIERALEKAKNGDLRGFGSKTPISKVGVSTQKSSDSIADGSSTSPYGHWQNNTEQVQRLNKSSYKNITDNGEDSEEERQKLEEKKRQEEKELELMQELERERKRKEKIQREYENAQKINDERLKEYMK